MSDAPYRILIVEDRPPLLRALVRALKRYPDLEVVATASTGEAALEALSTCAPDLILLDLELPDMGGLEVVRRARLRSLEAEVLVLTSFDDEARVFEAMREGAAGYLVKRLGPDRVHSAILEVMAGGVVLEAKVAKRFWNLFEAQRGLPGGRSVDAASGRASPEVSREPLEGVSSSSSPSDSASGSFEGSSRSREDPWDLSEAQRDLLTFLAKGLSNAEVGEVMGIERRAVRTQLSHLYAKMGVRSHVEAVVAAIRAGLIEI